MIDFLTSIFYKGKYEIAINRVGEHYFRLKASNGEIILSSESYKTLQGCENGIASVRENCIDESNFDVRVSKDRKRYFVLKAQNGETIGKSETYNSLANTINGINSVRRFGQTQEVVFL